MIAIQDAELPGLSALDADALRRITGAEHVSILRFRYRSGKRAILHLSTEGGEGTAWFFQRDKAQRLARRNKRHARFDLLSEAFFETFPSDHRMPQIRSFLEGYQRVAFDLIGGEPSGPPELLRYRPGLSCTFRCRLTDGDAVYAKLINDDSPARIAEMNRQMASHLDGSAISIASVIGSAPDYNAIAFSEATGQPFDEVLAATGDMAVVEQVLEALRGFWCLTLTPSRYLTADVLRERAAESVELTKLTVPDATASVTKVMARLNARTPQFAMRPIHADMKLEHLFIDRNRTTLIDTDCVSLGPTDYDLAQLFGRFWQAELEGCLPSALVQKASKAIRDEGGRGFDWCLDVVALRLAKFYAQRPTSDAARKIEGIMDRLS